MARIFSEDSKSAADYVAFFDLDRTIISEISGNALVRMAWKGGLISLSDLLRAFRLYVLFRLRMRDPLDIIDDMVGWVKNKTEAEMEELCRSVFSEALLPSVYNEAITEINIHKGKNAKVILLSSALSSICSSMAESLGLDGYICSSLETIEGFHTGKPTGRLCYGEEKLHRITGYCSANNIDQKALWYYGDSISDLPVLLYVGNPVCVNPDRELKKEAKKRGWRILLWKN
jgi:HAD superfamily hydrolase (TIGR01490 family)